MKCLVDAFVYDVFSHQAICCWYVSQEGRGLLIYSCKCSGKPLTEQGWVSSPWLHCWKRELVLVNQHQLHNSIIFSKVLQEEPGWILAEPQYILLIMQQNKQLNFMLMVLGYLIPVIWGFPFGPVLDVDVTPRTTVHVKGKALYIYFSVVCHSELNWEYFYLELFSFPIW